jgi:polyhydroxybutyrate depolymerase
MPPATIRHRPPRGAGRTSTRRRLVAALALATLAAGLVGCSDDGDGDGGQATDTGATTDASGATDGSHATTDSTDSTGPTPEPVVLAPPVDAGGTVTHGTITVDGRERTYRLYVPSQLPAGPAPLFLALHGGTGWADQFAGTNHVEGLAEANGFLVVHPDGVTVAGGRGGVWNGGVCCGVAAREGVDDVAFIDALLDEVGEAHEVDPARTYAFGHSNGGIMSYRLACELSERIVGIGVVAGTLGVERCQPARPVSAIHIHGTADRNLPYEGGIGPDAISGVDFPPPLDGFETLAAAVGCSDAEVDAEAAGAVTTERRGGCDEGTAVVFVTLEGANHAWPGGTPQVTPEAGEPFADYDATLELATFLLSQPRP